jgi:hypothetical protein
MQNSLGRPRRRWIDNIKMDLLEIGLCVVDWIGLVQDRYRYSSCERGNEPSGSIKCWEPHLVSYRVVLSHTQLSTRP